MVKLAPGMKINDLTLLDKLTDDTVPIHSYKRHVWICKCDNGCIVEVPQKRMHNSGGPRCQQCKKPKPRIDLYKSEYNSFKGMNQRCYDTTHQDYVNYGGRGIEVCKKWRWSSEGGEADFADFLEHVGCKTPERYQLDRIDNNGNYEHGNVRWASPKEQAANRRKANV